MSPRDPIEIIAELSAWNAKHQETIASQAAEIAALRGLLIRIRDRRIVLLPPWKDELDAAIAKKGGV